MSHRVIHYRHHLLTCLAALLLAGVLAAPAAARPGTVQLVSPPDGSGGVRVSSELSWRPVSGAIFYEVCFRRATGGRCDLEQKWPSTVKVIGNNEWYRFYGLQVYWAVRACNNQMQCGDWSRTRRVRFADPQAPGPATFASPPNNFRFASGAFAARLPVLTEWVEIFAADATDTTYRVSTELHLENRTSRAKSELALNVFNGQLRAAGTTTALKDFEGRDVRLRIRACNRGGCGSWSRNLYGHFGR